MKYWIRPQNDMFRHFEIIKKYGYAEILYTVETCENSYSRNRPPLDNNTLFDDGDTSIAYFDDEESARISLKKYIDRMKKSLD